SPRGPGRERVRLPRGPPRWGGGKAPGAGGGEGGGGGGGAAAGGGVAVPGLAGPRGATSEKPVGLVYLGVARRDGACRVERRMFPGDRSEIRQAALVEALQMLKDEARTA